MRRIRSKRVKLTGEQIAEAREYLLGQLAGGARDKYEIMKSSCALGISAGAIAKARYELGVKKRKYKWYIPDHENREEANDERGDRYFGKKQTASEWIKVICEDITEEDARR